MGGCCCWLSWGNECWEWRPLGIADRNPIHTMILRSDYNTIDGRRFWNTNALSTVADSEILLLKSLHWLKPRGHPLQSPVRNLQLPAILPAHSPSQTLHHPASPLYMTILLSHPFSTSWSLLISCSPTEPYPSLHQVSGTTCHLNSTSVFYLHHHHCQSQTFIFIQLLCLSLPRLSTQN